VRARGGDRGGECVRATVAVHPGARRANRADAAQRDTAAVRPAQLSAADTLCGPHRAGGSALQYPGVSAGHVSAPLAEEPAGPLSPRGPPRAARRGACRGPPSLAAPLLPRGLPRAAVYRAASAMTARAITLRWISLVPSPISRILASARRREISDSGMWP